MRGRTKIWRMFEDLGLEPGQLELETEARLENDKLAMCATECLFYRTGNSTTEPSEETDSAGLA